jgi:RNA polymerase sigma factor (TIGR02999 family)
MSSQPPGSGGVTDLLIAWSDGNREALNGLMPLVYADLRRVAAAYMQREPSDHALQPTALVHETYVRLIDQRQVKWRNRAHFFGVAAAMMRRILVDQARVRRAEKRGRRRDRR